MDFRIAKGDHRERLFAGRNTSCERSKESSSLVSFYYYYYYKLFCLSDYFYYQLFIEYMCFLCTFPVLMSQQQQLYNVNVYSLLVALFIQASPCV